MNVRRTWTKVAGIRQETIDLDRPQSGNPPPLTSLESEAFTIYGDILVEVGGVITPETGSALTLPDRQMRLPSDFPIRQSFDLELTNSASLADAWHQMVLDNISTALAAHLAKDGGTAGSTVTTLPI